MSIYLLQRITFELDEDMCCEEELEGLQFIIGNNKLNEGYLTLARDIEVMEPKSPEDIYKVHIFEIIPTLSLSCLIASKCTRVIYPSKFRLW